MAAEHLMSVIISGAGVKKIAIPKGGVIAGVYSDQPITIAYNDNGNVGVLLTGVTRWEPTIPFAPAPIAYLEITTTAAAKIAIRYRI